MTARYIHHFTVTGTIVDGKVHLTVEPDPGIYPDGPVWDTTEGWWCYTGDETAPREGGLTLAEADLLIASRLAALIENGADR